LNSQTEKKNTGDPNLNEIDEVYVRELFIISIWMNIDTV
jgi:hypothetical protein